MSSNLEKLTRSLQSYTDNKSYNSVIFSVNTIDELYTNQTIQAYASDGLKCFVKSEKCYYKYDFGKWIVDRPYIKSDTEPQDKSIIWINTSSFVMSNPKNEVTLDSLLATINTLISRIELLEARVEYLEEHGVSIEDPSDNIIDNVLLIEDGVAFLLDDGSPLLISDLPIDDSYIIDNVLLIDQDSAFLLDDGNPILY